MLGGLATVTFMSRRRLALAPLVALLLCGLVGGPAASAAPSASSAEQTATAAAKKKQKAKRPTVATLDKRLKKTERDLAAARRQLRLVQRATAGLVSGLDTIVGANGSLESLLYGDGISQLVGPELAKLEALLGGALAQQAEINAGAAVAALSNPALRPQVEQFFTQVFGVSPQTIGQSVANLGPAIQQGLAQFTVREQPVLFAQVGGATSGAVIGADLPDDGNPVSVSGSAVLNVTGASSTPVRLLAGVRTDEGDQPAAKVVLDTLEVVGNGGATPGGGDQFGNARAIAGNGTVFPLGRIERTSSAATTAGTTDIGQSALTVTGSGKVLVRFTARFTDDSPND